MRCRAPNGAPLRFALRIRLFWVQSPPADLDRLLTERLQPILNRLAALEGQPAAATPEPPTRFDPLAELADAEPAPGEPDWALVKRHFRRYGDPAKTAAKYGLNLRELTARARKEGWAA